MEEERRLCYVALTRAKTKLFLVNAKQRMLFGHEGANPPSRFIKEINPDLLDGVEITKDDDVEKIDIESKYNAMDEVDINVGDFVYHEVFQSTWWHKKHFFVG